MANPRFHIVKETDLQQSLHNTMPQKVERMEPRIENFEPQFSAQIDRQVLGVTPNPKFKNLSQFKKKASKRNTKMSEARTVGQS